MQTDFQALGNWFQLKKLPRMICPHCRHGILRLDGESIVAHPTLASSRVNEEWWDPFDIEGPFTGYLLCDNSDCKEKTVIVGNMAMEVDYDEDGQTFVEVHKIANILPPLPLFDPPQGAPDGVEQTLNDASMLLWSSPEAAANTLRVCIEIILEAEGIDATEITSKGNTRFRSPQERLEEFESTNPEAAKLLEAVKWVGNQGSHYLADGVKLQHSHVLQDAVFLRRALDLLYPTDESEEHARILAAANQVSQDRGFKR